MSVAKKVAVLGAAGGIGQPLSLLLKLSNRVEHLSLYDLHATPGIAADLGHCSTRGVVTGHAGAGELEAALQGATTVVIPAGVPRKPGMSRDDLFNTNASIVAQLATACARVCPEASILVIANPVNSTVPIVAETFAKSKVYDASRLFGVTTLDVMRARRFVADALNVADPMTVDVTVCGGHAGTTIMPLLSRVQGLPESSIADLTHRIQFGGDEVVKAKDGAGSATLSMAAAGAEFALQVATGERFTACTFVEQTSGDSRFFAAPTTIEGGRVVEAHRDLGSLSAAEQANYDEMLPALQSQIAKGEEFARSFSG